MGVFDPDRIAVYRLARVHSRAVHMLINQSNRRGFSDLIGQLRASVASVPANVLEAFGEWRAGKRMHYLLIAKGSTLESWAHVDCMVDFEIVPEAAIAEVRDLQRQISALLITMIRKLEPEAAKESPPE